MYNYDSDVLYVCVGVVVCTVLLIDMLNHIHAHTITRRKGEECYLETTQ